MNIKAIAEFVWDIAESFFIALFIFVIIYQFVAQPHRVRGDSMLPSFHTDDYLLTEKVSYRFQEPNRGDVVVFKYPLNTDLEFIKRIIGLPGETVLIQDDFVYINGEKLEEPYLSLRSTTIGNGEIKEGVEYTVPEGKYVVMGDHRERSSDSRSWGPIDRSNIVGKAFFRYWPPKNVGLLLN